jgi:glutaredoxin
LGCSKVTKAQRAFSRVWGEVKGVSLEQEVKNMKIIIYSTTTCPYCKMLKEYLSSKSIAFEEKLVDQDENAKRQMMEISGGYLGVPFTLVIKDDGSKMSIVGFDKGKFNSILGIQ